MSGNPFLGLLRAKEEEEEVKRLAENVFHISLRKDAQEEGKFLVLLEDLVHPENGISLETLKLAVFERLLLDDPSKALLSDGGRPPPIHVVQKECLLYLFECFRRLSITKASVYQSKALSYVIGNAATAFLQPALFEHQNVHRQMVELFERESESEVIGFMGAVAEAIVVEEGNNGSLEEAFSPVLALVKSDFAAATPLYFPLNCFNLLQAFANSKHLAKVLVNFMMPKNPSDSLSYVDTVLGVILNISCLPKSLWDERVEYFEKPLDGTLNSLESSLWTGMGEILRRLTSLIETLCRDPNLRPKVLRWVGGCLDASLPRGSIWGSPAGFPSDGFALNLAALLLSLSKPLAVNDRFLKIDPTYSAATVESIEEMESKGVTMKSFKNESCLQPANEGGPRPLASSLPFSFVTQIFHLTHRALDLSVRVILEKAQGLYQEIGQLQETINETQTGLQPGTRFIEAIHQRMEINMSRYLCMRCSLLEPTLLSLLGEFSVVTSKWLVQVLLDPGPWPLENKEENVSLPQRQSFAPIKKRNLSFPLKEQAPPTFRCIPEMVLENIVRYLRLAATYSPECLESGGRQLMDPILSLLLCLMGSNGRVRNPHLRALLAQALESLLPKDSREPSLNRNPLGVFYRRQLFENHPHKQQLVESLLQVFVSIEMTGQSVAFEQKFNYRRPMYVVMDYLWKIPCHRVAFKKLAALAEQGMEEVTPPLFLRFINLLMNDAVFLLDEALANMAQLRTMQAARDEGEWETLPREERNRNEEYFRQIGMTARFDNILGKETIHTLEYMSSEIKSLFCHSTMVDRIAAMLNYFLYHLVGPKKKNFKVKHQNEYKFEPGNIVLDICRIYIHLGESDTFCSAISRDGRSYSSQLFLFAQDVLVRIGGADLMTELVSISERVERLASEQQNEEEILAEAPEEFLDPIIQTLMSDPVILPSSRITVDRSTIARHLLSDQTDPFNRSHLTMNMVQSNTELKKSIEEWIQKRKASTSNSSASATR